VLSGTAVFSHRGEEWVARITGGKSMSYTITRKPGRPGRYLTAAWGLPAPTVPICGSPEDTVYAAGPVVGVDLNDGHLAVRRLDAHGNPTGAPERIDIDLAGSSARRDAQLRHAITRLIHYTRRHGVAAIAVEDLDFADARATGRETMGRGRRGKRFRRTVAGIPTGVFRRRLSAQAAAAGIALWAVNPAYSSVWGDAHWRKPYENVTRHQAAATVIGRRAGPDKPQASNTGNRHRPGIRGTTSREPSRARTRLPGRATVTPATANNGRQLM
jgi:hypothetical protein